jgi:hypothetical protein
MQTEAVERGHSLEPGQLWKIEHGYLYIVEVGKRLVQYKALRAPTQRAAVIRLIAIGALLKYLMYSEGQLILEPGLA